MASVATQRRFLLCCRVSAPDPAERGIARDNLPGSETWQHMEKIFKGALLLKGIEEHKPGLYSIVIVGRG